MSILFSLKGRKYYGLAYPEKNIATLALVKLFADAENFDHFLYEYCFHYFHEYLHLFFARKIGKYSYAEKTINRIVSRLLFYFPNELGIDNVREDFSDIAKLLDVRGFPFCERAMFEVYALRT